MVRPTSEELMAALPGPEDLGPGFKATDLPQSKDAYPSAGRMFTRSDSTSMSVTVWLIDGELGTPRQWIEAGLYWTKHQSQPDAEDFTVLTDTETPSLGTEAVRVSLRYPNTDQRNAGDYIAWRIGSVIASLSVRAPGEPDALPNARRLHDKVLATLPLVGQTTESGDGERDPAAPLVTVRTVCPPSHPIKALTNDAGARIHVRPLDPGYMDLICESCFASPSAAERAGYRHVSEQ